MHRNSVTFLGKTAFPQDKVGIHRQRPFGAWGNQLHRLDENHHLEPPLEFSAPSPHTSTPSAGRPRPCLNTGLEALESPGEASQALRRKCLPPGRPHTGCCGKSRQTGLQLPVLLLLLGIHPMGQHNSRTHLALSRPAPSPL